MFNKLREKVSNYREKYLRKLRLLRALSPFARKVWDFFTYYIVGLYNNFNNHHLFLFAGGLAFSLFICIIPIILLLLWGLGYFLDSAEVETQISTFIDTLIPYEIYASYAKEIIYGRMKEMIEYRDAAGIAGIVGVFLSASGFFSSTRTILNNVFESTRDHNFIFAKIKDFAIIILVILIFFVSTFFLPVYEALRKASEGSLNILSFEFTFFGQITSTLISFIVIFILFFVLYRVVPFMKLRVVPLLVGTLWAAVMWEAAKQVFGFYIYNLASYGRIYGAYAVLVVIAFWVYYSSIVFIIGAEISKLYSDRHPDNKKVPQNE